MVGTAHHTCTNVKNMTGQMPPLANRRFLKMNGLGNEITILDLRGSAHHVTPDQARAIAAHPASHFDQLMVLHEPRKPGTDAFVLIFNTDGSESAACGNGTRCVGWALTEDSQMGSARGRNKLVIETRAGKLATTRDDALVFTVDMGRPKLNWDEIPLRDPFHDTSGFELQIGPIDAPILHTPCAVNMGNPHAVFFVDDPYAFNLAQIGPLLENHPIFPERANIGLAAIAAKDHIILRVWERGAGITRACGSGACAALVAAVRRELTNRKATVTLPGGDLTIEWRESDGHVLMTGPVELELEGVLDAALFADAA
jgi:diaminopimelate epimerase